MFIKRANPHLSGQNPMVVTTFRVAVPVSDAIPTHCIPRFSDRGGTNTKLSDLGGKKHFLISFQTHSKPSPF